MTDIEMEIYNTHLKVSRLSKNKPYKKRKNFDNLDDNTKTILNKLGIFFKSYPNVRIYDFFMAPYVIYSDSDYADLLFYTTQKSKKIYAEYMKKIEIDDPDSESSLKRLMDSFKFIKNFCKEKGLTLENYPLYIEHNLPCMIDHLKNHHINMYALHSLGVSKIEVENRILDFIFSDFWITFQKTKNKYFLSGKMKDFGKKAIEKIQKQL